MYLIPASLISDLGALHRPSVHTLTSTIVSHTAKATRGGSDHAEEQPHSFGTKKEYTVRGGTLLNNRVSQFPP